MGLLHHPLNLLQYFLAHYGHRLSTFKLLCFAKDHFQLEGSVSEMLIIQSD